MLFSWICYISFFEPLVGFEPTTPRLQITCSGQLSERGGWVSYLYRAATTNYLCCDQALEDSKGAGRIGLTRFAVAKVDIFMYSAIAADNFFTNKRLTGYISGN